MDRRWVAPSWDHPQPAGLTEIDVIKQAYGAMYYIGSELSMKAVTQVPSSFMPFCSSAAAYERLILISSRVHEPMKVRWLRRIKHRHADKEGILP